MPLLILILVLLLGSGAPVFAGKPKPKPQVDQEQRDAGFRELFANVFSQWDRHHDGKLDLKELNVVIENPQIHGSESAIAVYFHRRLQTEDEEKTNGLTLADALSLADDPAIQKDISVAARK